MHFSSQNISCNKCHSINTSKAIVISFILLENKVDLICTVHTFLVSDDGKFKYATITNEGEWDVELF